MKRKRRIGAGMCSAVAMLMLIGSLAGQTPLKKLLLPEAKGWRISEKPEFFSPDTLFEHIDGAAESYLAYDFRELLVVQYQGQGKAMLTLEAYDMGETRNAFGIFSAERSPESKPVSFGLIGYQDEGTLNFVTGVYYVKLICFDAGDGTPSVLESFGQAFAANAGPKGALPPLIQAFPKEGLVPHSEKFVAHHFLGYPFLHDGAIADYQTGAAKFEAFFIEGASADEAERMLRQYRDKMTAGGATVKSSASAIHVRDKYALNVFLGRNGRIVCGVIRVNDGQESAGEKTLASLLKTAEKWSSGREEKESHDGTSR